MRLIILCETNRISSVDQSQHVSKYINAYALCVKVIIVEIIVSIPIQISALLSNE